jgi:hypothetical protein
VDLFVQLEDALRAAQLALERDFLLVVLLVVLGQGDGARGGQHDAGHQRQERSLHA